ncbi:hypothetical protein ACWDA9_24670 [Streptomyces sp. NPDC001193]
MPHRPRPAPAGARAAGRIDRTGGKETSRRREDDLLREEDLYDEGL